MSKSNRLRRQITCDAARLMYHRQESEYYRAKLKAARRVCRGWVRPADLPSNAEIRDEIQTLARLYEGDRRTDALRDMRLDALHMMRRLQRFHPRLIGSVLTGHVRQGSDIDIHLFASSLASVTHLLDEDGLRYDVERKQVRKQGITRTYTHIHVADEFSFELTVLPVREVHLVTRSSITGKPMERATIAELEQLIRREYPRDGIDELLAQRSESVDRFQFYLALLLPLESVRESPQYHPEGDALYHSLQVFDLARDQLPYDEEFLLAALLHDVGKAIDRQEHVAAGLEALEGFVTERTGWLIEHHMLAQRALDGTLGRRARRRLQANENYEDLLRLAECDRDGRQRGVECPTVDEALDYIRQIAETFGIC